MYATCITKNGLLHCDWSIFKQTPTRNFQKSNTMTDNSNFHKSNTMTDKISSETHASVTGMTGSYIASL